MAHREIKKRVRALLGAPDWPAALDSLIRMPARQVVNPLFGLLYHGAPLIKWRAVTAMGAVVAHMADEQMEAARIVMRRFMWNLNDESGGMGWGSAEAMGEIMARHEGLAREYGCILVSYADPGGNFLEHPGLQVGVLWALGRLGRMQPGLICRAVDFIRPYLANEDSDLRGMAVWALIPFVDEASRPLIRPLMQDHHHFVVYADDELVTYTIGQLAAQAIDGD